MNFIDTLYVIFGARLEANSATWTWSDQSQVKDAKLTKFKKQGCAQMSWHYSNNTDAWVLSPLRCDNDKAYHICQISCKCFYEFKNIHNEIVFYMLRI